MIELDNWLHWWRAGFVTDIHRTWHHLPWFQLGHEEQQMLYQDSPSAVRALCDIPSTRVCQPEQRTMAFIDLSPLRQKTMLRLFSALCNEDVSHLNSDDQAWCQRIVKAVRPSSFLPTGINYRDPVYQLSLFRSVFVPGIWSRLRLRFSQEQILQAETDGLSEKGINQKRLRALIDAALWRIEQS